MPLSFVVCLASVEFVWVLCILSSYLLSFVSDRIVTASRLLWYFAQRTERDGMGRGTSVLSCRLSTNWDGWHDGIDDMRMELDLRMIMDDMME